MQALLTSLKNPRWADAEQTMIDCEITTSQFGNEVLPFTACVNDVATHGREIFSSIVDGNYGEIGAYVSPPLLQTPTATQSSGDIPGTVL